jgi:hypothetical protein
MLKRIGQISFLALVCAVAAFGQSNAFTDANVDYTFQFPDAKWKSVKNASAGNVEFVYGDRNDGFLVIGRIASPANTPMADVIRDQEDKLQFKPGYVAGKQENFVGKLRGTVFSFEFVQSGRAMTGRYYFLRSGDSIYILRFTGYQDSMRSIRPDTDSIARTFDLKKS